MFNGFLNGDNQDNDNGGLQNQFVSPISSPDDKKKNHIVSRFLLWSLILTILLAIGAYLYTSLLYTKVQTEKSSLANLDNSINVTTFGENLPKMETLSKKLQLINTIYDSKQYVASMFFPILESQVESSQDSYVYFNNLSFKKDYQTNSAKISLSGVALDYPTLYRQINNFKFGKYSNIISDFQLGKFTKDKNGNIDFNISFTIDVSTPSFLNFLKEDLGLTASASSSQTVQSGLLYDASAEEVVSGSDQATTSQDLNTEGTSSSVSSITTNSSSSSGIEEGNNQTN